jgi:hypothetical protein
MHSTMGYTSYTYCAITALCCMKAPPLALQVLSSLTVLTGLTRLALDGSPAVYGGQWQQIARDVGKLHSLACLELKCTSSREGASLAPLSSLQQLTRIMLFHHTLGPQDAAVLAGLRQLQEVECQFESAKDAAVALAGCSSFKGGMLRGFPAPAPPSLKCYVCELPYYDTSATECLGLAGLDMDDLSSMCASWPPLALARCAALRALQVGVCCQPCAARTAAAHCRRLQPLAAPAPESVAGKPCG